MNLPKGMTGSVALRDGYWVVTSQPYAAIVLKRLIPHATRLRDGSFVVVASPDRTADLAWFFERYPHIIAEPDAWAQRLATYEDRKTRIASFADEGYTPPLFGRMALPPREYQRKAADQWRQLRSLLLADELGLGKTASAIAGFVEGDLCPVLVVTMTHLVNQWRREINRFAPHLEVHVAGRGTPYEFRRAGGGRTITPDVLIINYHKLVGWADALAGRIRAIVFDECQELRRSTSQRYASAAQIAGGAEYRIGLSATPVYNYGSEIFNVMDVLAPNYLGSRTEFVSEWCKADGGTDERSSQVVKDPAALGDFLRSSGLMLLRTRRDVGRELPPVITVTQEVEVDDKPFAQVRSRAEELASRILSKAWQGTVNPQERFAIERELDHRMRQATGLAKAPHVAAFVDMLLQGGEDRVLLYGWHLAVYDVWMEALKQYGPVKFTGEESPTQKDASLKSFLHGESRVLIMSLRAGAGVDGLQHRCRTVVTGELDWSPKVHDQGVGRVNRDGQLHPTAVYYCLANVGSDPVIGEVLGLKEAQSQGILGQSKQDKIFGPAESQDHIRSLAERVMAASRPPSAASAKK